jgi:hypothetical protein
MKDILKKLLLSAKATASEEELDDILSWVEEKNNSLKVSIRKNKLSESNTWFYDKERVLYEMHRTVFSASQV